MYVYIGLFLISIPGLAQRVDYCALPCRNGVNTRCRLKDCSPTVENCREEPMTNEVRRYIVDVHNRYRNKIATGKEPNYPGTVSNMRYLTYDLELEEMAQCHANECIFSGVKVHDACRRTSKFDYVGQNIYINFSTIFLDEWLEPKFTEHFHHWYDEILDMDPVNYNGYIGRVKPGVAFNKPIGHFSQMVWATTYKVGCARVLKKNPENWYKHIIMYVCNYGPGGNLRNSPIFKKGTVCSQCPGNWTCHGKYRGLCFDSKSLGSRVFPTLYFVFVFYVLLNKF